MPASVTVNNSSASAEPGEPAHGGTAAHKTLWWRWTAPRTARVGLTFYCCHIAAVYQASSISNLTVVPGQRLLDGQFTFQAQAGQTYNLLLGSYLGSTGGEIAFQIRDCPNDDFANRFPSL